MTHFRWETIEKRGKEYARVKMKKALFPIRYNKFPVKAGVEVEVWHRGCIAEEM